MSKLIRVINTYFMEPIPDGVITGLVLELEDGRFLGHAQNGYVMPFTILSREQVTDLQPSGPEPKSRPSEAHTTAIKVNKGKP